MSSTSSSSKTHVFSGVTLQSLLNLQNQAGVAGQTGGNYSLQFDPDRTGGVLSMNPGVGDVVVRFSHDSARSELTLTIVKKPMLLPTAVIWAGASQVLRQAADTPVSGD